MIYQKWGKRFFDLFFSTLALFLLWPIMLVVAVLVKIKLGSPILFCQKRPGLHTNTFNLYKFRTMSPATDLTTAKDESDRLSRFGHFLRATGLDELPQLINIFQGKMSFVGPRPLLVDYLPYYNKRHSIRHTVLPGLTGLAQTKGRNLSWEEKLEYDYQYVQKITFLGDVMILLNTMQSVIFPLPKQSTISLSAYPPEYKFVEDNK